MCLQNRKSWLCRPITMEALVSRERFYELLEIDKSKAGKNHQEKRYIDKELYEKTIQAVESRKYERCPTGDAHFKDWAKGFSVKQGLDGVKVLLSNPDKLIEKRRKQEIQRRNRQRRRAETEEEEEDLDHGRKRPKKDTKELPVLIKEKYFDEISKCHQDAKHSKEGTWRLVSIISFSLIYLQLYYYVNWIVGNLGWNSTQTNTRSLEFVLYKENVIPKCNICYI